MRLNVDLGPEAVEAPGISVVLSPDGTRLVFVGRNPDGGPPLLYVRRLDQDRATALSGTESPVHQPFFSPDSQWIGFRAADGQIKKVAATGGDVITVGGWPGSGGSGVSWADNGNLILGTWTGLWSLPATGGVPTRLTVGDHMFPDVLRGSAVVVFGHDTGTVTARLDDMVIDAVRLGSSETRTLIKGGYWPRCLPTSPSVGHLVYVRGGTLFGVGFDPARLEPLGTPVPVLEDVAANSEYSLGGGQVSVSTTGTLAYLAGPTPDIATPLAWLDPAGTSTPAMSERLVYGAPRLSPDGRRLAYLAEGSSGFDIWIRDLARGSSAQLTFLGTVNFEVAWAPDSEHLAYGDGEALWWIRADGAGQAQRLLDKVNGPRPSSFSPLVQGVTQLAFSFTDNGLPDVATLPLDVTDPNRPKPGTVVPFLTEADLVEVDPALSPDGRFMAYATNLGSVEEEIYVKSFPGPGGQWKVSTAGGKFPAWNAATNQLLYLGGDDRIMAVEYTTQGDSFIASPPRPWSPVQVRRTGVQQNFDVTPDGRRVITTPKAETPPRAGNLHVTFLLNFFDELRRRIPVADR